MITVNEAVATIQPVELGGAPSPTARVALIPGDLPLHRQLFLVLRNLIRTGAIEADQALPTEHALCEQYGVSRMTVRRALQDLADQGYVERLQGRGTFARDPAPSLVPLPIVTFLEGLRSTQQETSVDVVEVCIRTAPTRIARALKLPAGSHALYTLRVRSRDDVALMQSEAWLPERLARVVTATNLQTRALYELLGDAGITLGRVLQEITATSADPDAAQRLRTSIGAPLIQVNRLIHDDEGSPVQYQTILLSPDSSRIVMDINAEGIDSIESGHVVHDLTHPGSP